MLDASQRKLLMFAADLAAGYLAGLDRRDVAAQDGAAAVRAMLGGPLPVQPQPAEQVLLRLADGVEPGLVASGSPRYFGFVIGGALPVATAADWLTAAWDQNAQVHASSPAAAEVEEIVANWLLDLLGLPATSTVGLVTGGQMANFTALTVARDAMLARAGWDVRSCGLVGAPPLRVYASEQVHNTVIDALHLAGVGTDAILAIPADDQGRLRVSDLAAALDRHSGPAIVSAQAGNVNTGAFEDFTAIADLCQAHCAWLHVDGAFGLWAAASPRYRHLLTGADRADSWTVDAHKWLNVPYDSGVVVVRDANAHRTIKITRCGYAGTATPGQRDGSRWVPENSRRARGFVLYAALATLGRSGVARLIEGCCGAATQFAEAAATIPGCRVVNDVVLNQVLLRFDTPGVSDPALRHERIAETVRRSGVAWLGTATWQGEPVLRVSVSNWATTTEDVKRTVDALAAAAAE